jgi:hypothetical protein
MDDTFDNELEEVLRAEKLISESKRPSSGIWYYVFLPSGWELRTFPYSEYPPEGHIEFWVKYIVPELVKAWSLDADQKRKLLGVYRGMPRGRVDFSASSHGFEVEGEKPNTWYLFHGDDFPKAVDAEKSTLENAFNLSNFAVRGLTQFKYAAHEKMLPDHLKVVKNILPSME